MALVEALTGQFDAHHGELARILLDQIDRLDAQITHLTQRIAELVGEIDHADPPPAQPGAGEHPPAAGALHRLREIPGLSTETAQLIIGEIGLDMTRFPTAAHLVSWARLCPRTIQSGTKNNAGKAGKGNPYLKGVLGLAAASAARSGGSFLAERYRRVVKRRGKGKADVSRDLALAIITNPDAYYVNVHSAPYPAGA